MRITQVFIQYTLSLRKNAAKECERVVIIGGNDLDIEAAIIKRKDFLRGLYLSRWNYVGTIQEDREHGQRVHGELILITE